MTKWTFVLLPFALIACSSSNGGDSSSDASNDDALKARDAGGAPTDASIAVDASLPPLPPGFTQCTSCMQTTCEPEIAACDADPYCVQLLTCALESGCLASGGSSCVSQCATSLGLTPKEVAQETKLLEQMATSCASCLAECPIPDGGADAGK